MVTNLAFANPKGLEKVGREHPVPRNEDLPPGPVKIPRNRKKMQED